MTETKDAIIFYVRDMSKYLTAQTKHEPTPESPNLGFVCVLAYVADFGLDSYKVVSQVETQRGIFNNKMKKELGVKFQELPILKKDVDLRAPHSLMPLVKNAITNDGLEIKPNLKFVETEYYASLEDAIRG